MHLPSSSILPCRISTVVSILIIIYLYVYIRKYVYIYIYICTYLDDVPFHADTFIAEVQFYASRDLFVVLQFCLIRSKKAVTSSLSWRCSVVLQMTWKQAVTMGGWVDRNLQSLKVFFFFFFFGRKIAMV